MKRALVYLCHLCVMSAAMTRKCRGANFPQTKTVKHRILLGLLAVVACFPFATAFAQIQSTITCPAGQDYWDVLSVMMMDPGLAAGYHMEGITNGLPSAYIYTQWDPSQTKVYYVKNPQGNPWDINLYDSNYVYQWVTELQEWNGVNHWNDPTSCKKFNNASQNSAADFSMRWAARCAAPGGANSDFWNPPPISQPNNTNYYTYVGQDLQSQSQNLGYAELKLQHTGTMTITDNRSDPPQKFSITTLPLEYTYSCSAQNERSCNSREIFYYGLDTTVNPVDHIKHSYGWVSWSFYTNSNQGNINLPDEWVLSNSSTTDQLMLGQVSVNFQCFK
jgi:hypothetical protein